MEDQGASSRLTRSDALLHHHGSNAVSPSCFTHVDSLKGGCGATRSIDVEEDERKAEPSDFAVVVPLLQRTRRQRLSPPSFALAPAVPLPLWQRVAISALTARQESLTEQRNFRNIRQNVARELTRYHVELRERAERQRQQQRETRARAGERVAAAVQKYWARRGDSYQQLMKVEFDVVKHQHDRRKQEDLLRETEALTRKLLESFFAAAGKDATGSAAAAVEEAEARPRSGSESSGAAASNMKVQNASRLPSSSTSPVDSSGASFWAKVGDDDDTPIERALSLLDTEDGQRPLRHYQRSSLRWMVHLYENNLNGILADEMGLGKTVQTIALLCYYAEYRNDWGPHLIVVPTTVVLNWKAELDRWAPGLKVMTYIGSAKEREQLRRGWTSEDAFHVCITSYNLIVQDRKVFRRRPWGFLVLDEAHQVKNFMSLKWQSLFDLQAEYRLLLTGTPLQNSIMELWSLFHFLLPFASAFRSNADFKEWFSNPMDAMITGRSSLNEDIVRRLQALLRPFMLRRLKKDVESQLPTKTEKVVLCHLSRRQRSLYDDFMQLADTRQKLRGGGGAGGVFSVLLALRKVCDHPDLFEERPTLSPFVLGYEALLEVAVPRAALLLGNTAAVAEARPTRERIPCFYVVDVNADEASAAERTEERGVQQQQRLRCSSSTSDLSSYYHPTSLPFLSAAIDAPLPWWAAQCLVDLPAATSETDMADFAARFHPDLFWQPTKSKETHATGAKSASNGKTEPQLLSRCNSSTLQAAFLGVLRSSAKASALRARQMTAAQQQRHRAMQCARNVHVAAPCALELRQTRLARSFPALCPTVSARAAALFPLVEKVCVYVPAVLAPRAPRLRWRQPIAHTSPFTALDWEACAPLVGAVAKRQDALLCGREAPRPRYDGAFFLRELWPIQVRRSFGFPDKRLLIHDCGKLQFLDVALKEMRQEGHRVLIFTQFVNMLNILERFLALIGVAYLRLDGSTRAEVRQQLVDRFNADARLTCMILSTRSGGVGLNLTGADTVIFYDSDWNPTMDLQAQDRCHRIGQTRPVTIYRLISEHTVEESILRKARERKKLNNVVIRGGQFHSIAGVSENYEDSAAAFAALSDPVNLRSFFHDLDEDATVAAGLATLSASGNVDGGDAAAVSTSGLSMLEEMAKVEDEEDRRAGQDAARELAEREAEDAASEGDGDGDINDPSRKRARLEGDSSGGAARAQLSGTGERREESEDDDLWTRKGSNTLRDLYLLPHLVGAAAPAPDATESTTGDDADATVVAGNDKAVCVAVRKRQREMACKLALPVDQLLTLQYGRCQRDDAEARYDALVDTYTAQMDDMDLLEDEEEEEEEEEERGVEARLPRFRASYHLGSR